MLATDGACDPRRSAEKSAVVVPSTSSLVPGSMFHTSRGERYTLIHHRPMLIQQKSDSLCANTVECFPQAMLSMTESPQKQ